jgi:prepilin-type N-terminal cleavage/methylation domain-containing protein
MRRAFALVELIVVVVVVAVLLALAAAGAERSRHLARMGMT